MLKRYRQILEAVVEGAKDKMEHGYVTIGHTEFEYTVNTTQEIVKGVEKTIWNIVIKNVETDKSVNWKWDAWFDKDNNSLLSDVFLRKMDISRIVRLIMLTIPHYKYENRRRKRNKTLVRRVVRKPMPAKPKADDAVEVSTNKTKIKKPQRYHPTKSADPTATKGLVSLGDLISSNWP